MNEQGGIGACFRALYGHGVGLCGRPALMGQVSTDWNKAKFECLAEYLRSGDVIWTAAKKRRWVRPLAAPDPKLMKEHPAMGPAEWLPISILLIARPT